MLLKEQEEPKEADEGQGELEMTQASTDLVQRQLSGHAQQIVHVIEAHNEEIDILEEEFHSVKNGILFLERRLQTEKVRMDSKLLGVRSMVQ